jgi:hypothetical protein
MRIKKIDVQKFSRTLFYTLYPNVDVEITAIEEGATPIRRTVPFEEMALAGWLGWLAGKGDLSHNVDSH